MRTIWKNSELEINKKKPTEKNNGKGSFKEKDQKNKKGIYIVDNETISKEEDAREQGLNMDDPVRRI